MATHNDLGKSGEAVAAKYLVEKGYTIITINWIYRKYEIDIIARNEEYIIFAEVKTRSSAHWGYPEDAVSEKKIRHIVEAADFYLKENDIDLPARFDVMSIIRNGKSFDIEHIEDAFLPSIN